MGGVCLNMYVIFAALQVSRGEQNCCGGGLRAAPSAQRASCGESKTDTGGKVAL